MSQKRAILELLTRDELGAIAEAFGLHVDDRRVRTDLVAAIASSKKATLEAFLPGLSRDRPGEVPRYGVPIRTGATVRLQALPFADPARAGARKAGGGAPSC